MLRWFVSIVKKFFLVVPIYTIAASFITLISQMAILLAFFFPLKVLILLGSPELPDYFPATWQTIERNYFILSFVLASVGFYLLYVLSEKMIVLYTHRGAEILLEKSKKIILFKKQKEIATQAYQIFSRALASIVFLFLGALVIGILYPSLFGLLMVVGLLGFLLWKLSHLKNLVTFITFFSTLTFFLGFTFIVIHSLYGKGPSILEAIICLLLMRQLITRLLGLTKDLSHLLLQRSQIDALFFYGKCLNITVPQHEKDWQVFIEKSSRNNRIKKILHEIAHISPECIESYWQPTGVTGVLAFEVIALDKNNAALGHYFIKFFNRHMQTIALHEASLFMDPSAKTLPAFLFLGATQLDQCRCHIFSMKAIEKSQPCNLNQTKQEPLAELIAYKPSRQLLEAYKRSKPMLGNRLNQDMIIQLKHLTHDQQQLENLITLEKNLKELCEKLNTLPIQIINPDINSDTTTYTQTDEIKITHWGKWGFEPLGASWPIKKLNDPYFCDLLAQAQKIYHLPHVNDMKLAALLYAFENFYQKELYNEALELLPSILACKED